MEQINETNNNLNTSNTNNKKITKLQPIKVKMKKSESQPNLFQNKKNRVLSSINQKQNDPIKNKVEKKLFNNANDYQFLYKDIRNARFVVLWVKYLRNFPYNPGPVRHLGVSAPSFYEQDLDSFRKRFNSKKKTTKKINKSFDGEEKNKWNNLSMSNEMRNKRYNEFLPHIISRNDRYLQNENQSEKNEIMNIKSRYLHPFKYNYKI